MARFVGETIDLVPSEHVLEEIRGALARSPRKTREWALKVLNRRLKSAKSKASSKLREEIPLAKKKVDTRISTKVVSEWPPVGWLQIRSARFELAEYLTPSQIESQWNRQQAAKRGKRDAKRRATTPLKIRVYISKGREAFPNHFVNKGKKSGRWHVMSKRYPEDQTSNEIRYGPPITEQFNKIQTEFAKLEAIRFGTELARVLRLKVPL